MTAAAIAPPEVLRRRFTVAEYYLLGEVGILRPDERVELIDGEVIVMPPARRTPAKSAASVTCLAAWLAIEQSYPFRIH